MKDFRYLDEEWIKNNIEKIHDRQIQLFLKRRLKILSYILNLNDIDLFKNEIFSLENLVIPSKKNISITCGILTYNEEKRIKKCIDSVINCFDEILIIDTGSNDKTLQIVNDYNSSKISLHNYDWDNNFSNARNYGIKKAKNNWIFFIDADEVLDAEMNYNTLHDIFELLDEISIYYDLIGCPVIIENKLDQEYHYINRILKKDSNMQYYGAVHEEMIKNDKSNPIILQLNILIKHYGYSIDVIKSKDKLNRNIELIKKMMIEDCDNKKWKYYYVRDGLTILNDEILRKVILDSVLVKPNDELKVENIIIDKYTFGFLDLLCKIELKNQQLNEILKIANIMEFLKPGNSNSFYYKKIVDYINIKKEYNYLLSDTMLYRKKHFDFQENMISTQGYHIDLLIACFLFEINEYDRAKKYFEFLKDKFSEINHNNIVYTYYNLLKNLDTM